jgi:hypothetical protein
MVAIGVGGWVVDRRGTWVKLVVATTGLEGSRRGPAPVATLWVKKKVAMGGCYSRAAVHLAHDVAPVDIDIVAHEVGSR